MAFRTLQLSTATTYTEELCPISLDNDFRDAPVTEKIIQGLNTLMEPTWDDLRLRLTCSKRKWVESL
jgi:hypothetical protein